MTPNPRPSFFSDDIIAARVELIDTIRHELEADKPSPCNAESGSGRGAQSADLSGNGF